MLEFCPGAQRFRQPEPEAVQCPGCGREVELWTDEIKTTCSSCKQIVLRQQEQQSCLDWCKFAKECVGEAMFNKYQENKAHFRKRKAQ